MKAKMSSKTVEWSLVILFLVCFILGMASCKTVKQSVDTRVNTLTEEMHENEITADSASVVNVNEKEDRKSSSNENTTVIETTVVWSKPDSTGVQHPTKTIVRETETNKQEETSTNNIRDSTSEQNSHTNIKEASDLKSDVSEQKEEQTKTKVKTPAIVYWLALVILVFVTLVLKRCGLIKLW